MTPASTQAQPQSIWKWPISVEGFLGAGAAGTYLASAVAPLFGLSESIEVQLSALIVSTALVVLCFGVLLLDLGRKERALNVFRNPRSPMTLGSIFLSAFLVVDLLSLLLVIAPSLGGDYVSLSVSVVGMALAVGVLVYPGVLFGILKNIPLWNSTLVPLMFLASGVATGSAVNLLIAVNFGASSLENFQIQASAFALVVYGTILLSHLLKLRMSTQVAARESVNLMVKDGKKAGLFWGAIVAIGIVVPIITLLTISIHPSQVGAIVAAVCIIAGSLAMRYTLLVAAIPTPMRFASAKFYPKMKA